MVAKSRGWGGKYSELQVSSCTRIYTGWTNNEALLYSKGNYIQYPVINHNGKECMCVCVCVCECVSYNLHNHPMRKLHFKDGKIRAQIHTAWKWQSKHLNPGVFLTTAPYRLRWNHFPWSTTREGVTLGVLLSHIFSDDPGTLGFFFFCSSH